MEILYCLQNALILLTLQCFAADKVLDVSQNDQFTNLVLISTVDLLSYVLDVPYMS